MLQDELDGALLGATQFFNASDRASIQPGDPWRDRIMEALREAAVMLVIASPRSVSSPWVNFESGGGWLVGARVIPCCVRGMVPSSLPAPLGHLQALDVTTSSGVADLFQAIAGASDLRVPPNLNTANIADRISKAGEPTSDAASFADWAKRSSLRPEAFKKTTCAGEVEIGGIISIADGPAVSAFPQIKHGDSVKCEVDVPNFGTLRYCYASAEQAELVTSLASSRYSATRRRARVSLCCLGTLKTYATDFQDFDEPARGIAYEPAYVIEDVVFLDGASSSD